MGYQNIKVLKCPQTETMASAFPTLNQIILYFGVWSAWLFQKTVAALNEGPEKDKQPLMNRYLHSFTLSSSQDHWQGDPCSKYAKNKKLFQNICVCVPEMPAH